MARRPIPAEIKAINTIADRALAIGQQAGRRQLTKAAIVHDLLGTHAICPLALAKLAEAKDLDLAHDVFGIEQHLDREAKVLRHGFQPRYAQSNHIGGEV
jgi:hypothetical protein